MNKKQLEKFKKLLEDKRTELMARVRAARTSEQAGRSENAPDRGDRAISTVNRDLSYRLTTGEQDILKRIDAALIRIQDKSYGECLSCGIASGLGPETRRQRSAQSRLGLAGPVGKRVDDGVVWQQPGSPSLLTL